MPLKEYRRKRQFSRTPEPKGKKATARGHRFVIQMHAATRLHYDFRLEMNGVLLSWAVPKGPSLDPTEKRLAVQVEDHPLEYHTFEGTIPEGEYGAGTVMVWDYGRWTPLGDAEEDYRSGKLKFTLDGKKLQGAWMLVRMQSDRYGRRDGKPNWLLFKERDEVARPLSEGDILEELPNSARTDRTMDQIAAGRRQWKTGRKATVKRSVKKSETRTSVPQENGRATTVRSNLQGSLASVRGAKHKPMPRHYQAQLASLTKVPPEGNTWLHEPKFDGYRMFCRIADGKIRFISRNNQDWTDKFPSLVEAARHLPIEQAVLDGEVVVVDEKGVSRFQLLQNAFGRKQPERMAYFVFDLLYLDGYDFTAAALIDRKSILQSILEKRSAKSQRIQFSDHLIGRASKLFEKICEAGLEGMVSKRRDSPYYSGRSPYWLKCKCRQEQEFVIAGYTNPEGSRVGFGALVLGYYKDGGPLTYVGRVGTGFSDRTLRDLTKRLKSLAQAKSPLAPFADGRGLRGVHWVRPELVAHVEFADWTDESIIRHAAFLGLREDKPAKELHLEVPARVPTKARSSRK
jgi:bifunctional non-homologous end joining protein LigD